MKEQNSSFRQVKGHTSPVPEGAAPKGTMKKPSQEEPLEPLPITKKTHPMSHRRGDSPLHPTQGAGGGHTSDPTDKTGMSPLLFAISMSVTHFVFLQ